MGYESWSTDLVSPLNIDLDPRNPRLPGLPEGATKDQIIEELFSTSKVKEMVRSVAKSGFYPDQRVVVIRKDSGRGFVVIEGNRRVAACKVLLDPDLAPERHSRIVRKWSVNAEPFKSSFLKIPIVVAPSRLAATQMLASKHLNQAPVISWSRYAQGRFAINAFADGQDIQEVMDETGLSESDLRGSIQEARMFELFLGLNWTPEEKGIIEENLEKFPIESLSRILKSSATQEALGSVSFEDDGWITFSWTRESIEPILKRFLYDTFAPLAGVKKSYYNSRTLNDVGDVKVYLATIPQEIKPTPSKVKVSAKDLVPDAELKAGRPVPVKAPPKKKSPLKLRKVKLTALPTDIDMDLKNDKALALLDELQTIIPEDFSCATGLLLRSLLEIALIARIKKVGKWPDCMSRYGSDRNLIPTLNQLLKYAETCESTILDLNLRNSLSNQGTVPKRLLNLVAHNDQHIFGQEEARDSANKLTPLLRALLGPEQKI